jgi:hypothetical protein
LYDLKGDWTSSFGTIANFEGLNRSPPVQDSNPSGLTLVMGSKLSLCNCLGFAKRVEPSFIALGVDNSTIRQNKIKQSIIINNSLYELLV